MAQYRRSLVSFPYHGGRTSLVIQFYKNSPQDPNPSFFPSHLHALTQAQSLCSLEVGCGFVYIILTYIKIKYRHVHDHDIGLESPGCVFQSSIIKFDLDLGRQ